MSKFIGSRPVAAAAALALSLSFAVAAAAISKPFSAQQKRWWAFQKVVKPPVPEVSQKDWVATPVDAFVLAKLEEKGIKPNPPADKITLLRRVSLDLTGLPPTPEETQAFLSDNSSDAWAKVVDRLLASPRYGERWARHWLDLARYADSEGFKLDETRPNMWRYRDYVIKSLNADKPYDRFVKEQIAGDELYPGDPEALIATGFHRHFPDESNARNVMQRRQEVLNDITDVTGATFLGMTYGCARCHDHKFDPILHKDYYRLQAFFANTRIEDEAFLMNGKDRAEWEAKNAAWEEKTKAIRAEMKALIQPIQQSVYDDNFSKFPEEIQAVIRKDAKERTPYEWQMYHKSKWTLTLSDSDAVKRLKGEKAKRYAELEKELAAFNNIKPVEKPIAQVMIDNSNQAPPTYVLKGGAYDAKTDEVAPGFLSILDPEDATIQPMPNSTGRRAALAAWVANPDNPLSTRVAVNRIWHYHFGRGIAGTPSDFGVMGERPTHKELLDYLTRTFVEEGWSFKKLHRMILLSNTYRQSSAHNEAAATIDPDNKLMWRWNRRRLEGEVIRDSMLQVSGMLNTKMYGPGVFPPMPAGVETRGGWKKDEDPSETLRRSVYVFVRRNTRYPMFEAFDMPDTHESCSRRAQTVGPSQSLELLNNDLVFGWSQALAARVLNDKGLDERARVERAYRLTLAREPKASEVDSALSFFKKHREILMARATKGEKLALPQPAPQGVDAVDAAVFVDFVHILTNTNEFLYLN
jgi:hypothetical protein